MKAIRDWSLRSKVLAVAGIAIVGGFSATIGLIASNIYHDARQLGLQRAHEQADAFAKQVEDRFQIAYQVPRHLADTVQGMQASSVPDRQAVNGMQQKLLSRFPDGIGIWMLWEPNAFDHKDDQFRHAQPYQDPSGRYTPYFSRSGNEVKQDLMIGDEAKRKDFDKFKDHPQDYKPPYEEPGWGDFYFVPKQRNRDTITEPYPYKVQGKQVLESSLAVAIKDPSGKFLGVSAMDIPLDGLQASIGSYRPFGVGHVTLLSNGGLYVVSADPASLGKPADTKRWPGGVLDNLKNGQSAEFEQDGILNVWRSVKVGDTGQNWALGVAIPMEVIVADAVKARNKALLVGAVVSIIILAVLSALLTALTRPLDRLARAMEELSSGTGDLTRRLTVSAKDEIGRTSEAFNHFMADLAAMFTEVRVQSEAVGKASGQLDQTADVVEQATNHQAEAATATAASVEQVTVSIQHIADSARAFEQAARQTGATTTLGQTLVADVAREIEHVNESVSALAQVDGQPRPAVAAGQHHRAGDQGHRRADQSAGAERGDRGGARRRTGARLRGGGGRGAQAGGAHRRSHRGNQRDRHRHPARDRRRHRRHAAHPQAHRQRRGAVAKSRRRHRRHARRNRKAGERRDRNRQRHPRTGRLQHRHRAEYRADQQNGANQQRRGGASGGGGGPPAGAVQQSAGDRRAV